MTMTLWTECPLTVGNVVALEDWTDSMKGDVRIVGLMRVEPRIDISGAARKTYKYLVEWVSGEPISPSSRG